MSGLRTITFDEVAKHNTKEDCWVIVEDKVWDLTGFAVDHPGGAHLVQEQAGKDGTTPFVDAHSTDIIQLTLGGAAGVKKALMGVIDRSTVPASAVSGKADHGAPPAEADDDADEWEVPPVEAILNVHDLVAIAERKLVKEGKKQAWDYYSSGACDELTYQENELAFKRIWMRPRVLVDVKTVDLTSKILGATVGAPLFLSACAMCGMGHEDGELAWAESAAGLDIPFMSPNLSSKSRSAIFAAQQASPTGHRMFQIYVNPDRDVVLEQLRACEAAGVTAVCVTVDSAVAGPRERDQRNKIAMLLKQQAQQESAAKGAKARKPGVYANRDPALNWKDVAWFCSNTTIPIVLKGVQCGEDAVLAAKAGVAAILVDVVKALALGANACGIGKPAMYGMSCYGAAGITKCVEILKREMVQTMQLCGTPRFDLLSPSLVDIRSLSNHSAPPPKQAPSPYTMPPPHIAKILGEEEWEVPPVEAILNVHDLVAIAERKLVKEGKKQAWDYYSSGACDELTYQENELAFKRIWMRPRVLVDVKTVDLTSKILGATVGAPLFLSACAMCGMGHEDGELAWAESAAGLDIPCAREAAGVTAVCVTVDSAVAGPRERDQRNKIAMLLKQQAQQESAAKGAKARKPGVYANRDPALNWKDVAWFCSNTTIPIVLKGVQCGEDAVLAAKAGVAAILVSNHGGRNMDTARSSIEALPEIISMLTEAGLRSKLEVWLDGGIRRGSDVVKALALGANACGIGKPAMYGMSCYGAAGITKCVEILKREMVQTMQLCGAPRFDLLSPSLVDTSSLSDHSAPPKQAPSPYAMPPALRREARGPRGQGLRPQGPGGDDQGGAPGRSRRRRQGALGQGDGGRLRGHREGPRRESAATLIALFLSAYVIYRVYPLLPMHFGVHIATMALGAFGLPTLALHLVRKRTAYKSMADRTLMVKLHAATQVANVGCFTFGARAIYLMKEEKGLAHLASTHSKIGLLTLMLSFASFCIAMRRTANLKKLTAPKWVWGDWLHKQLGVATYVVGAVAGANGLYVSKWGNGVLGFPLVYVVCALTACMVVMALAPVDYKKHAAAK
ncbi:hypothetical protein JL720_11060 [Aureococcus anophagefferens]|nr:hypothetical protein JL720_11060 [Aureococcus anophagefferens]